MERAARSPYASSGPVGVVVTCDDDDDPKSQLDLLIERGAQLYMDSCNSGLSSDDDSDNSDYDSESDITDVSPIISAGTSPLGLSPVLPRRTLPTSPLALHSNTDLELSFQRRPSNCENHEVSKAQCPLQYHGKDSTNMQLLLQAVIDLEKRHCAQKRDKRASQADLNADTNGDLPTTPDSSQRKSFIRRKNMSFSNDEVRKIDRENRILLKKILATHHRKPHHFGINANIIQHHNHHATRTHHRQTNSSVNRKRDEEKIRRENIILLKKIQEAKPSKEVIGESRSSSSSHLSQHALPSRFTFRRMSSPASCSASLRKLHSLGPPHHISHSRKEPAL